LFFGIAIALEGGIKYIDMAKTDTDFDAIRDHTDFQKLLDGEAI